MLDADEERRLAELWKSERDQGAAVVIAQMGVNYLARSFFVVILGGAGSIAGVAAGSAVVGGIETVLNYQVPVTVSQALVRRITIPP